MTATELATVILVLCGKGTSDYTFDCRNFMVNCAVSSDGSIEKQNVSECIEKQRKK